MTRCLASSVLLLAACAGPGPAAGGDSGGGGRDDTGASADSGDPGLPSAGLRGLLIAQDWGRESAPLGAGAGRYRIIVLQESMHTLLPGIREANPEARIIAYQKAGGMRADGGDNPSTGVQIGEAEEHEEWFLHDAEGNRLYYCDYTEVAAANIGDPGYQQRWLENVSARLAGDGFDGVMMDDVNTFPGHCLGSKGTPIAEYETDEAYGDAVVDFMAAVGPGLVDEGYIVAPNIAMNPWDDTMRAQNVAMFPSISHQLREYWMRWDESPNFTGDEWLQTLTLMEEAQDHDVPMLALTLGPGEEGVTAGQRYGRASWLLAWDGQSDSAWGYLDEAVDPWSEEWALDIGLPTGPREAEGPAFRRPYSGGTVLVNPDALESWTFTLDAPHLDPEGREVELVTLGPGEGLTLVRLDPDSG